MNNAFYQALTVTFVNWSLIKNLLELLHVLFMWVPKVIMIWKFATWMMRSPPDIAYINLFLLFEPLYSSFSAVRYQPAFPAGCRFDQMLSFDDKWLNKYQLLNSFIHDVSNYIWSWVFSTTLCLFTYYIFFLSRFPSLSLFSKFFHLNGSQSRYSGFFIWIVTSGSALYLPYLHLGIFLSQVLNNI